MIRWKFRKLNDGITDVRSLGNMDVLITKRLIEIEFNHYVNHIKTKFEMYLRRLEKDKIYYD